MRAAVIREVATAPVPATWEEPGAPGEGQTVVEVIAAGLNPVDLRIASGTFYGGTPPIPYIPGREAVGRTEDGTLVYFDGPVAPFGAVAERALVQTETVIPLPDGADPAGALAFGVAGLAGWLALSATAQLRPGESVLVLGASGIVGRIAVQAARLLGAGRVVAAARHPERARDLGADAVCGLSEEELHAACPAGADVIVDPLWGEPLATALGVANFGARIAHLGESASATAALPSDLVRGRTLKILGHTNFAVPAAERREAYLTMVRHAVAGELSAPVETVALDEITAAWERQAGSPGVKLAVAIG